MSVLTNNNEEEILINQIHDEIRKIRQCKTMLDNNSDRMELYNPIEKAVIENNSFSVIFDDKKLTGCSVTKLNPVEDLHKDFKKELEHMYNEIGKLVTKIKDLEDLSARLTKNNENLQLMLESSKSSQIPSRKLETVERNIKLRFIKEKKELKTIIMTLFPDNLEIQDIIAQITEFYFTEGPENYMQLENSDNIAEQIEFLLRTELFEINPKNRMEIRLSNLI